MVNQHSTAGCNGHGLITGVCAVRAGLREFPWNRKPNPPGPARWCRRSSDPGRSPGIGVQGDHRSGATFRAMRHRPSRGSLRPVPRPARRPVPATPAYRRPRQYISVRGRNGLSVNPYPQAAFQRRSEVKAFERSGSETPQRLQHQHRRDYRCRYGRPAAPRRQEVLHRIRNSVPVATPEKRRRCPEPTNLRPAPPHPNTHVTRPRVPCSRHVAARTGP